MQQSTIIKHEAARLILLIVMCTLSSARLCSGNLMPFVHIKLIESKKTQIRVTNISESLHQCACDPGGPGLASNGPRSSYVVRANLEQSGRNRNLLVTRGAERSPRRGGIALSKRTEEVTDDRCRLHKSFISERKREKDTRQQRRN